jgi:hypothetical protein
MERTTLLRFRGFWIIGLGMFLPNTSPATETVSFRNDVMAILSRAGCNQGSCHGNLNGKGGFKLSLRGEDSDSDYGVLTREMMGRRLNLQKPKESLLLRKATGQVDHEGGVRFSEDSKDYRILLQWIQAGAPADKTNVPFLKRIDVSPRERIIIEPEDRVRIEVQGHFSDGSSKSLNDLVVLEPTSVGIAHISSDGTVRRQQTGELVILVRYLNQQLPVKIAFIPNRKDFTWKEISLQNEIDRILYPQWKALQLMPSDLTEDSMFLRRAYLDTIGLLPTVAETKAFLNDTRSDKRNLLIEQLLQRPEFSDFWALKWSDLLHNEEKTLDRKGVRVFHHWIRQSILEGKPLNQFAKEIVSARGSTYQNPATNFYRAIRATYDRSESVAQVFLGIRLQCARCHNHPFDKWTQTEYHRFASFFSQIDYRVLENNRRDRFDKHEFDGEQIVFTDRSKKLLHPKSGEALKPLLLSHSQDVNEEQDRLDLLGEWIASKENPFFAKAQINRIWYHLMGRGLVDPNDDLRVSNPACNEELLAYLAKDFVDHDFNLRYMIKKMMTSRTYQLSSETNSTNREDESHFSHSLIQPLEAEQLLDSLCSVLDTKAKFGGYPKGYRAMQIAAPQMGSRRGERMNMVDRFLKVFGKPERLLTCECERSDDAGLLQAFQMINGEVLQEFLSEPDNRIGQLQDEGKSDSEMIREFYLATLCRYPTPTEEKKLLELVEKNPNRRAAFEDIVWGLVNSKEFLLRR